MAVTLRQHEPRGSLDGPAPALGHPPCESELQKLSAREFECARLVAKGFSNKEVGLLLGISHWTVAAHMKSAFLKVGVRRRGELAYMLRREV